MTEHKESAAARTARERLEHTRRELLRHMDGEIHPGRRGPPDEDMQAGAPAPHPSSGAPLPDEEPYGIPSGVDGGEGLGLSWQNIRQAASAWWQSHPAHLALDVAEPVFEKYARAHPMRVLAISAASGAALVLARPWRLISVTGLLVAAVKSTQMSAMASAMLRPRSSEPMRRHEAEAARAQERQQWRDAQAQARARDLAG